MEIKKIFLLLVLVSASSSFAEEIYTPLYPEDLYQYATESLKESMREEEKQHRAEFENQKLKVIEAKKTRIAVAEEKKQARKEASAALVKSMEYARKEREEKRSKAKAEKADLKEAKLENCAYYKEKLWYYEGASRIQEYDGKTGETTWRSGEYVLELLEDYYLNMRQICDYDNWYRPDWRGHDDWEEDRRQAKKGKRHIK